MEKLLVNIFILTPLFIFSQKSNDINQSIIAQAHFSEEGTLTLSWIPKENADAYQIKYRGDLEGNWLVSASNIKDTFFVINDPVEDLTEYLIETTGGTYANTNILVGNKYFKVDVQKHMLILVIDSIYDALSNSISDYRATLEEELIKSTLIKVGQSMTVMDVKNQITDLYAEEKIDYIFMLGHVPVPYSGNSAVDGHTNHTGAWVADGFYGDVDGNWTDFVVDNTSAQREANHNVPGDGKFDQLIFPSQIEIAVGRVDFSDLPKLKESEIELTYRYLERNIAYRTGQFKASKRAIIDNNFNHAEGFAQGAIISFHTFLEADSISYGNFDQCKTKDYLFTFGAGSGNYQGASGIISTNNLVNDSIQSVFTTIFGSYFGDWDSPNNLLRASLARGSSLINAWSGRPIWYFHPMAMGKSVGQVLLNTQNNNGNYYSQFGKSQCHISLLGDPSLKMYYPEKVQNMVLNNTLLTWEVKEEAKDIIGFTVYYKEGEGEWKALREQVIAETYMEISELPVSGSVQVMVRPVSLVSSRSGSYYNEGGGQIQNITISSTSELVDGNYIYPNPATNQITLYGMDMNEITFVYDAQGKLTLRSKNKVTIDISHLSPGMYILKNGLHTYKFVKE